MRAIRGHQQLPGACARAADQGGAGREARRRRTAARRQGLSLDRQGAPRDAGRGVDLAAAAPRHLFDRGSGRADPRLEERESRRAHQREAGRRAGSRHHRRRRRQGARGRGAHLGPRRRHRRLSADFGIKHAGVPWELGSGRDASGAGAQRPAQPDRGRGGRTAEDRARRGDRRAARRGGVRIRHRAAGRARLRDDARLSSEHLPGGRRHAGPAAAREVHGRPRARRQLHALHRPGGTRVHGGARLPHLRRDGRPLGAHRDAPRGQSLEGAQPGSSAASSSAATVPGRYGRTCQIPQDHGLETHVRRDRAARSVRGRRSRRRSRCARRSPSATPTG